jgi:DnaJ homolog subfamily C member 13
VVLTGEPALVAASAALLETVLRHNGEVLPRLYRTGIFFFGLAYCGSNLTELSSLFRVRSFADSLKDSGSAVGDSIRITHRSCRPPPHPVSQLK